MQKETFAKMFDQNKKSEAGLIDMAMQVTHDVQSFKIKI